MHLFTLLVICMLLSGCQSTQQGGSDFYTWVDETGQVRTVKKQKVNTEAVLQEPINKSQKRADFNPIDFTPSEDVEKKLNNDRLFAWQDASGAQVVREESHVVVDLPKKNISTNEVNRRKFKEFRLGVQVVFNEIDGVAFDLARYYQFSDQAETDFILIELLESNERIEVKSFINNSSVAMPQIIPLTKDFSQKFAFDNPFQYRELESWYGYGFLYGILAIPKDTRYLLLLPNPEFGVIEAEGEIVKQSNLGNLVFTSLD